MCGSPGRKRVGRPEILMGQSCRPGKDLIGPGYGKGKPAGLAKRLAGPGSYVARSSRPVLSYGKCVARVAGSSQGVAMVAGLSQGVESASG